MPSLRLGALAVLACAVALAVRPAGAAYHLAVIDEVVTSVGGDPEQQFVEIRQLAPFQTVVGNSVLGAFDASGTHLGDVLVVPGSVASSAVGTRWIMATQKFQDVQAFAADFTFPPGKIPVESGMLCWGGPPGTLVPPDPTSWDHTDPTKYLDCVAYGAFVGANSPSGPPVPASPADHALARTATAARSDQSFACTSDLTPTNNSAATKTIAGAPCPALPPALAGGPPLKTDCYGEWLVAGATAPKPVVRCRRGQQACDPGGSPSACTLRVHLCFDDAANALYGGKCTAGAVTRFALAGRARDDTDRANVQRVLDAVKALGGQVSGSAVDFANPLAVKTCTGPFQLAVPLRVRGGRTRSGTRIFRASTTAGTRDADTLKVVCTP